MRASYAPFNCKLNRPLIDPVRIALSRGGKTIHIELYRLFFGFYLKPYSERQKVMNLLLRELFARSNRPLLGVLTEWLQESEYTTPFFFDRTDGRYLKNSDLVCFVHRYPLAMNELLERLLSLQSDFSDLLCHCELIILLNRDPALARYAVRMLKECFLPRLKDNANRFSDHRSLRLDVTQVGDLIEVSSSMSHQRQRDLLQWLNHPANLLDVLEESLWIGGLAASTAGLEYLQSGIFNCVAQSLQEDAAHESNAAQESKQRSSLNLRARLTAVFRNGSINFAILNSNPFKQTLVCLMSQNARLAREWLRLLSFQRCGIQVLLSMAPIFLTHEASQLESIAALLVRQPQLLKTLLGWHVIEYKTAQTPFFMEQFLSRFSLPVLLFSFLFSHFNRIDDLYIKDHCVFNQVLLQMSPRQRVRLLGAPFFALDHAVSMDTETAVRRRLKREILRHQINQAIRCIIELFQLTGAALPMGMVALFCRIALTALNLNGLSCKWVAPYIIDQVRTRQELRQGNTAPAIALSVNDVTDQVIELLNTLPQSTGMPAGAPSNLARAYHPRWGQCSADNEGQEGSTVDAENNGNWSEFNFDLAQARPVHLFSESQNSGERKERPAQRAAFRGRQQ
jgi:hypothetical protein